MQDHELIPRDPVENVELRLKLIEACKTNKHLRRGIKSLCKKDAKLHINLWCWQFNPDEGMDNKVGPFCTYPFQDDAIDESVQRWIFKRESVIWEKSRKMGASWMAIFLQDWACIYHKFQAFLDISHSEKAVDDRSDIGTLFGKIDFAHKYMPSWLTQGIKKRKLGFKYEGSQSSIKGFASTGRSGVGDRGNVLLDELGKQQHARSIVDQTVATGPRLMISTHYGIGTCFQELCDIATEDKDNGWRPFKIVMHWSKHPVFAKGLYKSNIDGSVEILDKTYPYEQNREYLKAHNKKLAKHYSATNAWVDYPFVLDGTPEGGPCPGLRSPWYDKQCISEYRNKRAVAQHLDINPHGADSQFFEAMIIRELLLTRALDPVWEGDIHYDKISGQPIQLVEKRGGPLKLWRRPDLHGKFPLSRYAAGSDLSTGSGATNTCLTVADAKTREKILEYADPNIGGDLFAPKAAAICRMFKGHNLDGALLAWELQGPGILFGRRIIDDCGYRRIYYHCDDQLFNPKTSERPGWIASPKGKRTLLEDYRDALQTHQFINRSREALEECRNFRYNIQSQIEHSGQVTTDDPSGARENHGDRVIADALAFKMMGELGVTRGMVVAQEEDPQVMSWAWRRKLIERFDAQREEDAA